MWPLCSVSPYSPGSWTNDLLAPRLFALDEKSVPMGVPPRVFSQSHSPHVMPLHQSDPWEDSLKRVAHLVVVHSALFSEADQDGEVPASAWLYSVPITVLLDMLSTL